MPKRAPFVPPSECPICGAAVPAKARACPQCGADERTGWNEEATRYDGLDLPDAAFDEPDEQKAPIRRSSLGPMSVPWFWWAVGLGILILLVSLVVTGRF